MNPIKPNYSYNDYKSAANIIYDVNRTLSKNFGTHKIKISNMTEADKKVAYLLNQVEFFTQFEKIIKEKQTVIEGYLGKQFCGKLRIQLSKYFGSLKKAKNEEKAINKFIAEAKLTKNSQGKTVEQLLKDQKAEGEKALPESDATKPAAPDTQKQDLSPGSKVPDKPKDTSPSVKEEAMSDQSGVGNTQLPPEIPSPAVSTLKADNPPAQTKTITKQMTDETIRMAKATIEKAKPSLDTTAAEQYLEDFKGARTSFCRSKA